MLNAKELDSIFTPNIFSVSDEIKNLQRSAIPIIPKIASNVVVMIPKKVEPQETFKEPSKGNLNDEEIFVVVRDMVITVSGISENDFESTCRKQKYVLPRMMAMYFIRMCTEYSCKKLGKLFQRERTNILHHSKTIFGRIKVKDEYVYKLYKEVLTRLETQYNIIPNFSKQWVVDLREGTKIYRLRKFTDEQKAEIKLLSRTRSLTEISRIFDCDFHTISKIVKAQ